MNEYSIVRIHQSVDKETEKDWKDEFEKFKRPYWNAFYELKEALGLQRSGKGIMLEDIKRRIIKKINDIRKEEPNE